MKQGVSWDMAFPAALNSRGKRLMYRLLTRYRIGMSDIEYALQSQFHNLSSNEKWWKFNEMSIVDFLHLFLVRVKCLVLTKNELEEMILTWDRAQKGKVSHIWHDYIDKEMAVRDDPKTSEEAQKLSFKDWEDGFTIGEALYKCVEWLLLYAIKTSKNIVVYGRDGEIIYDALMWLQGQIKTAVDIKYIVCSRNQLRILEKMSQIKEKDRMGKKVQNVLYRDDDGGQQHVEVSWKDYDEFIGKLLDAINPKTIHVDTGYKGTIPEELHSLLGKITKDSTWAFTTPDIRLLYSSYPNRQIGETDEEKMKLRMDGVIHRMEHRDQKLRRTYTLNPKPNRRAWKYSCYRWGVIHRMQNIKAANMWIK